MSVQSVLEQSYADFEVIVVDNASEDRTAAIAQSFRDPRIRFIHYADNVGMAHNWDRALAEARGRYVKIMTHDDLLYPACLERQVRALEAHPEASLVAARRDIIDESGRVIKRDHGLRGLKGLVSGESSIRATARSGGNPIGETVAVLARRSVVERLGPFDDSRPYVVDIEFWVRALDGHSLVALEDTLAAFRVSSTSLSVDVARRQGEQVRGFVRELRERYPDEVGRVGALLGQLNATLKGHGRRALYRALHLRRVLTHRDGPSSAA